MLIVPDLYNPESAGTADALGPGGREPKTSLFHKLRTSARDPGSPGCPCGTTLVATLPLTEEQMRAMAEMKAEMKLPHETSQPVLLT